MPSFSDSIVLFILALLLFGPKKLPALARELGKWIGEFRRASNEFKMQMDEEMRQIEQAERLKKIEEMEAAAPKPPSLETTSPDPEVLNAEGRPSPPPTDEFQAEPAAPAEEVISPAAVEKADGVIPIATSGELSIMPPATGLPTPQARGSSNPLSGLVNSIPPVKESTATEHSTEGQPETTASADTAQETAANAQ